MSPQTPEKKRMYMRAYNQRPEVKARRKAYTQRPEVKEKAREYQRRLRQKPEIRERERLRKKSQKYLAQRKEYLALPESRAHRRAREQRLPAKAKRRDYYQRPEVRARYLFRRQRPDVKAQKRAYAQRPAVKARLKLLGKVRRRNRGITPRRQTRPEETMEQLLYTHFPGDWKYTGQGDVTLGRCAPDFFNVNGKKSIIEVYGCYYHNCPTCGPPHFENARPERDSKRIQMFEDMGYKTLVIWEHELKDPMGVVLKIRGTFYA